MLAGEFRVRTTRCRWALGSDRRVIFALSLAFSSRQGSRFQDSLSEFAVLRIGYCFARRGFVSRLHESRPMSWNRSLSQRVPLLGFRVLCCDGVMKSPEAGNDHGFAGGGRSALPLPEKVSTPQVFSLGGANLISAIPASL